MNDRANIIRFQALTVGVGFLLMCSKFIAYFLTNSNSILTDALESIINVAAGMFAFFALRLAAKPRDADHPYGHGKIEFISASIEGFLITVAGFSIVIKSIYNFFYPQEISSIDTGVYFVLAAGLINYIMGYFLVKKGTDSRSLTLVANGKHLKTDAYSSLGLLIGLVIIWISGWQMLDNIVAIIFGGVILYSGVGIIRTSVAGIMDEADFDLIENLINILNKERKDDLIDVHNLRIIKYGSQLHIDCHVTLPWYYDLSQGHEVISHIERVINSHFPEVELFIHMDPCIPSSCPVCTMENCSVRKHPFEKKVLWNKDNMLLNKKHTIEQA